MTHEDSIMQQARELGRDAGKNAAEWYLQDTIGGRATRNEKATARAIIEGLDNGDPAIMDALPWPDLSGQWADDPTPDTLAQDLGIEDDDSDGWLLGEACDAWDDAATTAVIETIETACRELLEREVE